MENKEIKKNAAELNDEMLENVSGGTRDAEANLENEYIKEETMLIIPIILEKATMEQKLKRLFDYQKFQKNPRLKAMLADAEGRYEGSLSDDDLELVSAAGEQIPDGPIGLVIPELNQ